LNAYKQITEAGTSVLLTFQTAVETCLVFAQRDQAPHQIPP